MANSEKNIVIRPRTGESINNPVIEFVGADSSTAGKTIIAEVTPVNQGTITFTGVSGTILTLSDSATNKFDVNGNARVNGDLTVTGSTVISGATTFNTDIIPDTDNTGNVGTVALTWNDGRFTNFTVDSTLTTTNLNIGVVTIAEYIADTVGAMVTSNTESGISVTYDDADNTLDFDVADFTITLTGDVTGTGTVTNLGNVSFATTIAADSVALGTDTTGNYIATIAGTTNQVTVTGSGTETAAVTLSLPQNIHTGASPTFAGLTIGVDTIAEYIADTVGAMVTSNTESGISVTYDDVDNTLDFDVADFTITLTGDVTGTGTVTNLGNVSFATTIAANSVALGTDTTGNYMVNVSGTANEIEVTHTQGEGSTATIGLPDNVTVTGDLTVNGGDVFTTATTFNLLNATATTVNFAGAATTLTMGAITGATTVRNNLTVSGDLTVSGTTTTINTETLTLADNIIILNSNETAAPTQNAGIEIERGTSANVALIWDETTDRWTVGAETFVANTFIGALTGNASTATTLQTARTINGVSFNGSADISITSASPNALTIGTGLSGTSYNGSAAVTIALASGYGDTLNPYASKTANFVLAAPNGAAGVPTFRAIVAADIPTLNQSTTGSAATLTTTRTLWGQNFNGGANVTGALTSVGNITGAAGVTLTATAGTLGLVATGVNIITATTNAVERLRIDGAGLMTVTGNIVPEANNTRNIGSASLLYNTMYATLFSGTAVEAYYADLAENYEADQMYEPGTVLIFGGEKELTTTTTANNFRVAGVVSTEPATLMNSKLEGDTVVPLALQGRVPCMVIGRVEKGDMIVTSGISGYGMVNNNPTMGTVIGKAVGTKSDTARGWVEVVVGRV